MTPILMLIVLLGPAVNAPRGSGPDEKSFRLAPHPARAYEVRLQGHLVGYGVERCSSTTMDGARALIYASRTVVKTGRTRTIRESVAWVKPESGRVLKTRLEIRRERGFEIKEVVFKGREGEMKRADQEGVKAPETIELPQGWFFAFCRAAPALHLMSKGVDEAELAMFSLDDRKTSPLRIRAEDRESLTYHGSTFACRRFVLEGEDPTGLTRLWITDKGRLIRLEQPARGLSYSPASPKDEAKLIPEVATREGFHPAGEAIGDRGSLTYLAVEATLEAEGLEDAGSLTVPNQRFEGIVAKGRIEGTFRMRSERYENLPDLGIAAKGDAKRRHAAWLASTPEIPSEDSRVAEAAAEVTERLNRRKHAIHALGTWVRRTVTFDATGTSNALDALEVKRGAAAAMARLYTALCRNVGIPARTVSGGLYVREGERGGFVAHVWAEVHMGERGWIPMDPATGNLGRIDAGRIRLGEGVVFRPETIRILDHIPRPAGERPRLRLKTTDPALAVGRRLSYGFYVAGQRKGTAWVTREPDEKHDGESAFRLVTRLKHDRPGEGEGFGGKTIAVTRRDGRMISFQTDLSERERFYKARGNRVTWERWKDEEVSKGEAELPREGLFYDTHHVFLLGFLLSRLDLEIGRPLQVDAFHPSSERTVPLDVERVGRGSRMVMGNRTETDEYRVRGAFSTMTLFLTPQGLVVEEIDQGGMVRVVLEGGE